jgi:RNA polymerase sigma-70 factor (ECF subfamily)
MTPRDSRSRAHQHDGPTPTASEKLPSGLRRSEVTGDRRRRSPSGASSDRRDSFDAPLSPDRELGAIGAADVADLYREYAPVVLRSARRILRSRADADEIVHDVFVSFLQRPEQCAGAGCFPAFLYGAVTNACLNRIRNVAIRRRVLRAWRHCEGWQTLQGADPEDATVLRSVLGRLPDTLVTVALHHHLHGRTHDEIAQLMGCSRRHIGNLILRISMLVNRDA